MNVKIVVNFCFEKLFDVFLNYVFENLFWLIKLTNVMVYVMMIDVVLSFCRVIVFKVLGELNIYEFVEFCKVIFREVLVRNCSSKFGLDDVENLCDLF